MLVVIKITMTDDGDQDDGSKDDNGWPMTVILNETLTAAADNDDAHNETTTNEHEDIDLSLIHI